MACCEGLPFRLSRFADMDFAIEEIRNPGAVWGVRIDSLGQELRECGRRGSGNRHRRGRLRHLFQELAAVELFVGVQAIYFGNLLNL